MPEDLSYLNQIPTEEEEKLIRESIEREVIKAIAQYLTEVADTMQTNSIECLNEPTVRAMAAELLGRYSLGADAT